MKHLAKLSLILAVGCSIVLSCDDEKSTGTDPLIGPNPVVTITSPANNALVADLVQIEVQASDDKGVYKVEFYIDGNQAGFDPAPPYLHLWDASGYAHGSGHSIYAVAFDTDGNSTASSPVICTIDTALAAPLPVLLYAGQGVTTSIVPLIWEKSAANDFDKYVLQFDLNLVGEFVGTEVEIPWQFDTTQEVTGLIDTAQYRFQVLVVDIMGNSSPSNTEFVTTLNGPPPQPVINSAVRFNDRVRIAWMRTDILDFSSYEVIQSVDSVYDLSDEILATIVHIDTATYNHMTIDTSVFYYFVVVSDQFGLSSVSQPYEVLQDIPQFALFYNGATYCTVPYFSELNVGEAYTLEAWVNQTVKRTYMRVIDKSPGGSPYFNYSLISDNYLGADVCDAGSYKRVHANIGVTLNEWHHIALTYDNGTIIYYIDGNAVGSNQTGISTICSHSTTLNIGRRKLFDEFYFRGMIDEVRVWNVVRTPSQIASTYNIHLGGNETGLVCSFGFDEGEGQVISTPVGSDGYLGEESGVDSKDPVWVVSTVPFLY